MAEYQDNIRRLAKGDKVKDALGSWAERDPIKGGITPFITAAFAPASTGGGSGTDNATADSENSNGTTEQDGTQPTDGADPNTFNKGSGGGGGTPYTVYGPKDTGQQDLESVIEGDIPQQSSDGSFDSSSYVGAGSMTSVTGMTDCDGNPLKVRFDGEFVPPEGWDDPDTPPADTSWDEGYYWKVTSSNTGGYTAPGSPAGYPLGVTTFYASKGQAAAQVAAALAAWTSYLSSNYPGSTYSITMQSDTSTSHSGYTSSPQNYDPTISVVAGRYTCDGGHIGQPECPTVAPTATEWPIDGSYDLSLIDGSFQANDYDSEAPENAGGSSVDVKYASGTKTARIQATAQGGYMIYETTGCGGAASGIVKVYNADGTFAAAGDATQTFIDQYLPK